MLSTFYYFFSSQEKESALLTFLIDLIVFICLAFYAGMKLSTWGVVLWMLFFVFANYVTRIYDDWREGERRRLLDTIPGWRGGLFPQPWVEYADLWTQFVGREMSKVYIVLLLLGKIASAIF